jgi:HAD superfamily hydrolase (TIGR01509 family)
MAATTFIFDLDGTVWDSYPWYAALACDGSESARDRLIADLRAAKPAAKLLRGAGITKARFRDVCRQGEQVELYPGALPTLLSLTERRTALGAVTNLPGWVALPMLRAHRLDELFESVVTYERTTRRKPHPEPLVLCCDELGAERATGAWYVGDSLGDCKAAQAAGISFAWARWGYCADAPPGANAVLERFADVEQL